MPNWKRPIRILVVFSLLLTGFGSLGVAFIISSWPATNAPSGNRDDWYLVTLYIVAAFILFASSGFIFWLGFKHKK